MAGFLSTYGANAVLDGTAMPATLYAKLHTGNPSAAGTANAATETTRKSFTRAAASGGATSNAADISWPTISGSQDATHLTLWDNVSAGNCWAIVPLTANAYTAGDTLTIAAGDLDLSLDIWA
jgi:hypothetical protein